MVLVLKEKEKTSRKKEYIYRKKLERVFSYDCLACRIWVLACMDRGVGPIRIFQVGPNVGSHIILGTMRYLCAPRTSAFIHALQVMDYMYLHIPHIPEATLTGSPEQSKFPSRLYSLFAL
jgi:hypothetical protein